MLSWASLPFLAYPANAADLTGRVVAVSDGDTITVLVDKRQVKVRLAEIDAPEKMQAFGQRAKQALSDLVYDKTVMLDVVDTDRYGRSVARVLVNGVSANEQMVSQGMAWCYRKYLRGDWCLPAEAAAREAKNGLWADPDPTAPWEWRKNRRALNDPPQ